MTRADITYDIQNNPSYQVDYTTGMFDHTVSGTITTNGTIGMLTSSDILSWSVTFDGTYTFNSSAADAVTLVNGTAVTATPTQITVGAYPS